ncbi:MAG TPA: hypothetical protein PKD68_03710 [Candidatus Saccharibacteria bacterium]|nr:hypothetical protein [Candidatus Saccharibacteria bacterium]
MVQLKHMQVLSFLRWWYGEGWLGQLSVVRLYLRKVSDFFSVSLLLRNFFQPFRQISAGSVRGSLGVQFRAWLDRLISRMIGALVRFFMIVAGSIWWCLSALIGMIGLVLWPLLPFAPLVGVLLAGSGVLL